MRWLFRISLTLAFLGLTLLAAWPYLPQLQKEWQLLVRTWEQVRAGESSQAEAVRATTEAEPSSRRTRKVITPDQITEKTPLASEIKFDPFLAEARRRAEADPEAAMQWLQLQSTGSERLRGMLEVVALWAAEDSESALLWLESNAGGLARLETLNSGIELWAETDPLAAAAWIDGMANDGSKLSAAKSLAGKWVREAPEAASAWVSGLAPGPIRDNAAAALVNAWAEIQPEAANIWAFAEAEFNRDDTLLVEAIHRYTSQSPAEAEAFLRQMAKAYAAPDVLAGHVLARAEQDPAATAEWLSQLPSGDLFHSAQYATGLMQVWAETDSIAASQWLSEQSPGEQRDAAIFGFSESIQRFEPEAAAAWANTIDDPDQRLMRLEASLRSWAQAQPVEASQWIKGAELEPTLREKLASLIPRD